MRSISVFLIVFIYICGCSVESDNDSSSPLFAAPVEEDSIKDEQVITTLVEPLIENEQVEVVEQPVQNIEDVVAPKLLESTIEDGDENIDSDLESISLRFNEEIAKSNIRLFSDDDISLRWIPSVNERRIFLNRLNGVRLEPNNKYVIKGVVEDISKNQLSVSISFDTNREIQDINKDRVAPSLISSTVRNGDVGIRIEIERFVFTFNEDIENADVSLFNNSSEIDMNWVQFISGNRIILQKLPGEGSSLNHGESYTVRLRWSDAAGNWEPKDFNAIRVITFFTEIKE